ncbi:MAG: hypothetical protein U0269_19565 [Polyangiales bacterium]
MSSQRSRWTRIADVEIDPLRLDAAITHGHISRDEQRLYLRTTSNAVYVHEIERGARRCERRLERSLEFAGFLGDSQALLFGLDGAGSRGAWILALDDERSEPRRVCDEAVFSASVAPDHRSAALLTASGALVVIDGDGARVRLDREPRITERSRVIALTRERVVLVMATLAAAAFV